jgi:hypothetical protein
MVEHKDLGISKELSDDFDYWISNYGINSKGELSVEEFDTYDKDLAIRLKKELGNSVKVIYAH